MIKIYENHSEEGEEFERAISDYNDKSDDNEQKPQHILHAAATRIMHWWQKALN